MEAIQGLNWKEFWQNVEWLKDPKVLVSNPILQTAAQRAQVSMEGNRSGMKELGDMGAIQDFKGNGTKKRTFGRK